MGIGEAAVTILSEDGVPTPVVHTRLRAPASRMGPADDVEGAIDRSLGADRVRALCERLVPDQRDVLLLRLLGDLSIEQIAETLGKSKGAVKALQRRGLAAVGRLLEREGVPL